MALSASLYLLRANLRCLSELGIALKVLAPLVMAISPAVSCRASLLFGLVVIEPFLKTWLVEYQFSLNLDNGSAQTVFITVKEKAS